ncbi:MULTISPECIES: DUF768 domain-containing protein [unclassified Mesorhizobium]|uniref:DUF768 domain-containing protein n=1 Tax=unclassified Mesorhizobium TaxID=325217 RepID=UPI00112B0518|nr:MULTISPECIES: DUF768 domain-containing protein [unclassified Mesorhizobium]MBZ9921291.1 DUF768 domain-containing protein [Mesorhizobium sp. BR1-1-7]MBZ9962135.1 DUF768 domain-containing protein [Mesorhizobium sp. BR1-1-14]MBZ9973738.1 DUF768 domain-containing protein [Mesorhizobium sp. BR1-1-12]TPL46014.1 DUF768 domain-containing protein [Mesorhizobium sp. B2-4-4]
MHIEGGAQMDSKPAFANPKTAAAGDADLLVNKTAHFVGEWIDEHISDAPSAMAAEIAAEKLADQCISDAESEGILADEISEEVGDLKEYIAKTVLADDASNSDSRQQPAAGASP